MSKKVLILSLILAFTVSPMLALAQATQVDLTPQAHAALVSDIEKKINDLMVQILLARIAELQAMIVSLQAQASTTQIQLGAVQTKVDSVVTQTAPAPIPVIVPPTISVGATRCVGDDIILPITVSGKWSSGEARRYINGVPAGGFGFSPNATHDFVVGDVSLLATSTQTYSDIADNPYLNGSTFSYKVRVGTYTNDPSPVEVSNTFVPSCQ